MMKNESFMRIFNEKVSRMIRMNRHSLSRDETFRKKIYTTQSHIQLESHKKKYLIETGLFYKTQNTNSNFFVLYKIH